MYPALARGSRSSTGPSSPRPARRTGIATTSRSTEMDAASASGVRTVPCRTGRSAVASYSRTVISLRARTRNSSGWVETSRRPARLSATSGWLLTFSGTVALDHHLHRIDGDAQHSVHVLRVEMMDLAGAQLIDAKVDRARAQLANSRDDEERRRLHVVAEHARPRPHVELFAQLARSGHGVGQQVGVQRIDRADDAYVVWRARGLGRVDQRVDDIDRRDRRIFGRDVSIGRPFATHRADADDEVPHLDLGLGGSTRAHAQERVHPKLAELLDRDRHRRAAHAGRDRRDRNPKQAARERAVLTAERDLARVI